MLDSMTLPKYPAMLKSDDALQGWDFSFSLAGGATSTGVQPWQLLAMNHSNMTSEQVHT